MFAPPGEILEAGMLSTRGREVDYTVGAMLLEIKVLMDFRILFHSPSLPYELLSRNLSL